ncbi:MAG: HEAT repeat domain-containing protein [Desulfobacterales bacterium]|nr:HEAT repeat domain-containing protein [Desulfobacterales bacterium]
MVSRREGGRALKQRILKILRLEDPDSIQKELDKIPAIKVVNHLFSFLYHADQKTKWAAVNTMGAVVAKIADEDMEEARVIMRRLMWNLNDESGGIGWGSPEAMGEIMARHEGIADEYSHILMSYTNKDGNYLEHEMLQQGLLWGIGRLARIRPQLVKGSAQHLSPYLESEDAEVRGLARWVIDMLEAM